MLRWALRHRLGEGTLALPMFSRVALPTPMIRPVQLGSAGLALGAALLLAGQPTAAAAAGPGPHVHRHHSPTPTPSPAPMPSPTPGTSPSPTPMPAPSPRETPVPAPTAMPVATAQPGGGESAIASAAPGVNPGSGASAFGAGAASQVPPALSDNGATGGQPVPGGSSTVPGAQAAPTVFGPASAVRGAVAPALSLQAVRIPPIEALSPVAGLDFGEGLQLGPALLFFDLLGLVALAYVVRRRWMRPPPA
jgi:hypothetical protein